MAQISMTEFIHLGTSIKKLNRELSGAKERGGEKVTVDTKDLEKLLTTFSNFHVQILNPKS